MTDHLPDAVIGEPYHLPECSAHYEFGTILNDCICDMLRACEQRVLNEAYGDPRQPWLAEKQGYSAALDAAEAAVAELFYSTPLPPYADEAVSAIRALKERP